MPLGLTGYCFREARGLVFRQSLANRAALMVLLAAVFPGVANARSYALLVGVGQQPAVDMLTHRPLKGTGNDIKNMRQMLLREYRFQEQDIRMLLDGAATLPQVREEFAELAAKATKDDVVVFHYAGHGTAIPDDNGDEFQDGIDEALCLYGCGADMTGALRDDELGRLLDELPASEVVVVLDCCHSGTATRSVDGLPRVGQIRFVPARLEDAAWNRNPAGRTRATKRSTADELGSAGREGQKRIVFSACAARQQAWEINPITGLYAVWSGSLTYFLVEGLRGPADSNGDGQVSYLEAQSHVVRRIDSLCNLAQENEQLRQNPVLEATPAEVADAPVFRLTDKTPAYAALTAGSAANKITLDLGAIHGIKPGQRLGVFPMVNGTPRLAQPMAEVVVETLEGETSDAILVAGTIERGATPTLVAAPLVDPLASPDVRLNLRVQVDNNGRTPAVANSLGIQWAGRLINEPRIRLVEENVDLELVLQQLRVAPDEVEVRVVLIDIARQETQFTPTRFAIVVGQDQQEKIAFDNQATEFVARASEWLRGRLSEFRLRRTVGGLSNPRPGFGIQLVTNIPPTAGKSLAEISIGTPVKAAVKSSENCWPYLLAIHPSGRIELWYEPTAGQPPLVAGHKVLFPGPGEFFRPDQPGVYLLKLIATKRPLKTPLLENKQLQANELRALPPDDWSETSYTLRVTNAP